MRGGVILHMNQLMAAQTALELAFGGGSAPIALLLHFRVKLFTPIVRNRNVLPVRLLDGKFNRETIGIIQSE